MRDIHKTKLRRLDFTLLMVFQEIYRRRRAAAAAERLGLSQPAISHALARLREVLDDPLFVRGSRGMQPTARAIEIAPQVETLLRLARDTVDGPGLFHPKTTQRLFRLSANDFAAALIAAPLIRAIAQAAPNARLSVSFAGGPAKAYSALRNGDLDLAIGRFPDLPTDCVATLLFEERYQVIARRKHPRLRHGLDFKTYLDLEHLIVSFAGDLVGTVDEALARQGGARRVVAALPMFLTAFAAVARSDLIATAPRSLVRRFGPSFGLIVFEPPFKAPTFSLDLIRARSSVPDSAIDWFAQRIRLALPSQ
jgi:DNA-binding transcriptional LysR family regulator